MFLSSCDMIECMASENITLSLEKMIKQKGVVVLPLSAFRQFKKLGNYIQKRIDEKLVLYTSQSNPLRFADK